MTFNHHRTHREAQRTNLCASLCTLWFILFLIACSNSSTSKEEPEAAPISIEQEDDLVSRLALELNPNPASQFEKDKNQIIDYAIEKLLDVKVTKSGLHYVLLKEGEGANAEWGDYVTASYKGSLTNGKVFDSNDGYSFYIGNMIKGWNEGLQFLKKGGKAIYLIPSYLGYGEEGFGKLIPPNSVLIFEVELTKIKKK